MATKSAGPLLAAGALTWANQTILAPKSKDIFETSARIGVATGVLVGGFFVLEKAIPELAIGLAWVGLVTTLLVRFQNTPTPLERVLSLAD